jgi:hypothetical protein
METVYNFLTSSLEPFRYLFLMTFLGQAIETYLRCSKSSPPSSSYLFAYHLFRGGYDSQELC